MKDYLNIGSSPPEEDCCMVGSCNYAYNAKKECLRYIDCLRKFVGVEPFGAELKVKSFPHDFGTYYEVVCYFDDDIPESLEYALKCEGEGPMTW